MKIILFALAFLSPLYAISAQTISPDTPTRITLSSDNPNRFHCVSGLINDTISPAHIPKDTKTLRDNFFYTYKMKPKSNGDIQYVKKNHDIHIVCDGQVYTVNARQKRGVGRTIYLGDPIKKNLEANARLLQEESIEDIMVKLFLDAYNENLPPNYTVKKSSGSVPINSNLTANLERIITLNGVGLRLKEYSLTSNSKINLYKPMFMKKEVSEKIRMIGVYPPVITPSTTSRLFIVEDK